MNEHKIKRSDVAALRTTLLSNQGGVCGICEHPCDPSDAALDHDHKSGRVRMVVHKDCNILLGKIENFVGRYGKRLVTEGRLEEFLEGCVWYMGTDWSDNPYHWMHKTEEDKLRLKYQRLMRRSKKPETKAKYKKLLQEMDDGPARKGKAKP